LVKKFSFSKLYRQEIFSDSKNRSGEVSVIAKFCKRASSISFSVISVQSCNY